MVVKELVGARVKRAEDPRLITGRSTYTDDIRLPDMVYMAVLRSPHAHARIRRINTRKAQRHPGVLAVLTGKEVMERCGPLPCDYPLGNAPKRYPLTPDKARHVGDPVAAVVAVDRATAKDALDLIEVDYEVLPAVVDPERALRPRSPKVHDDLKTNVALEQTTRAGDIEKAFREADRVVRGRFINQRLVPMAMEPRAAVAWYQPGPGTLTLWNTTQNPHHVKVWLGRMLKIPENRIRVIAPEVGGGFGSKIDIYNEEVLACLFSMQLGRPVKWTAERREDFQNTIHGRDEIQEIEVAVKEDGTILGLRARLIHDMGSYYMLFGAAVPTFTPLMLTGPYQIPNVDISLVEVFTNKAPYDAYRGAARPEATYLLERAMDLVAHELKLDPAEVRRRNFIPPDRFPYTTPGGLVYDSGNYGAALDKALEMVDYRRFREEQEKARQEGKLVGLGITSYVEICGLGPSAALPAQGGWESARVRVERTGKVTVYTGISPHGQGEETAFAQIVAQQLGVPPEDVVVVHGDTEMVPEGIGTYGSRGLPVGGAALVRALERVREKAQRIAAHRLGVRPDQVRWEDGRFVHIDIPEKFLTFPEVASLAYLPQNLPPDIEPGLEASAFFEPPNCTFPFGTCIATVEVDPDTGQVALRRFISVVDCGVQINPMLVDGQIHGGIAQGVGQALYEFVVYDENGQLLTGSLMDYAVPTAEMLPPFETGSTVTPTPVNPLGAKGVGECGTIGATPAVVNAVADALAPLGVHPAEVQMPCTPENVWRLIQKARRARRRG